MSTTTQQYEVWAAQIMGVIAAEIRHYRHKQGLSVQQLSDRLASEYGLTLKRSVLSNLEHGRRPSVSVPELLVLADALRVPPLLLLTPLGRREEIEILPGRVRSTWRAARWITAEQSLAQRSEDTTPAEMEAWWEGALPARAFREHARLLSHRGRALMRVGRARYAEHKAVREKQPELAEAHRLVMEAEQANADEATRALTELHAQMAAHGLTPPPLPETARPAETPPSGPEENVIVVPYSGTGDHSYVWSMDGPSDLDETCAGGGEGLPTPREKDRGGAGAPAVYGSGDFRAVRKPGRQARSISGSAGGRYVTRTSSPKSPKT